MWKLCHYHFNTSCKRTKQRAKNFKNSLLWQRISVNWHKVNGTSNNLSFSSYNVFILSSTSAGVDDVAGLRGTRMSGMFLISTLYCWERNWESNPPLIWEIKSQWKLRAQEAQKHSYSLPYRKPSSVDPKHPRAQCSAPIRTVLKTTHSLWQYSRVPPNSGVNCCSSMYISRSLTELSITTYKQGSTVGWLIITSTQAIHKSSLQICYVSKN